VQRRDPVRHTVRGATATAALLLLASARLGAQQPGRLARDSVGMRVSALLAAGDRQVAYRLADSLLTMTRDTDPGYPDALYWRAFASANAAAAERDYLKLAIEYPLSERAEDALLLLAQLESARGDRTGALRHLDRLQREHPGGRNAGKAAFWTARLALDMGDSLHGCSALTEAQARVPREDVETRNQMEYFALQCATVRAPVDSAGATGAKTPPGGNPPGATANGGYSVQIAAFNKKSDAQALARRLKQRGFEVRVAGTTKPFRVRIGRYASRAEAEAALGRLKKARLTGRVVDAERA